MPENPSQTDERVLGNHWVLTAKKTFTGVKTGMNVPMVMFPDIVRHGALMIVEGISVQYFRVGGTEVVSPMIHWHCLDTWTAPAVTLARHAWYPLGISFDPTTDNIVIYATTANLDDITMSAWGRFVVPRVEPEEVPVGIKSIFGHPKK